jgi:hypothetical protein
MVNENLSGDVRSKIIPSELQRLGYEPLRGLPFESGEFDPHLPLRRKAGNGPPKVLQGAGDLLKMQSTRICPSLGPSL